MRTRAGLYARRKGWSKLGSKIYKPAGQSTVNRRVKDPTMSIFNDESNHFLLMGWFTKTNIYFIYFFYFFYIVLKAFFKIQNKMFKKTSWGLIFNLIQNMKKLLIGLRALVFMEPIKMC